MSGTFGVESKSMAAGSREVVVLALTGTIDGSVTTELEQAFAAAIDGGGQYFILDFSRVEYISSAGLRLLLKLRKAALDSGGSVTISGPRREIRENVFDALGFSRLVSLYPTVEEAAESIAQEGG